MCFPLRLHATAKTVPRSAYRHTMSTHVYTDIDIDMDIKTKTTQKHTYISMHDQSPFRLLRNSRQSHTSPPNRTFSNHCRREEGQHKFVHIHNSGLAIYRWISASMHVYGRLHTHVQKPVYVRIGRGRPAAYQPILLSVAFTTAAFRPCVHARVFSMSVHGLHI